MLRGPFFRSICIVVYHQYIPQCKAKGKGYMVQITPRVEFTFTRNHKGLVSGPAQYL
jgi:hypothetical protein